MILHIAIQFQFKLSQDSLQSRSRSHSTIYRELLCSMDVGQLSSCFVCICALTSASEASW